MNADAAMIALIGQTASGKSSLGLRLAKGQGGEILSCDSVQLYRGFNIGAAKPSPEEQAQVRHHMIDVAHWQDNVDAADYVRGALKAIEDMRSRGVRPILCGGSGLYLRALRFGLIDVPEADAALRAELESAEQETPGSLFKRLQDLDPKGAAKADAHNKRRLLRDVEICILAKRPVSQIRAEHAFAGEKVAMQLFGLRWPDDVLRARIVARTKAMLENGLLEEVEGLLQSGVAPECKPMQSVGYKEACAVLTKSALEDALAAEIQANTWTLARRQRTWFKKEKGVEWLEVESIEEALSEVEKRVGG
jgi:tRNA dimethylallyltransferase